MGFEMKAMGRIKWAVMLAICLSVCWVLPRVAPLEEMELGILYKLRGEPPTNTSVWIVSIDEEMDKIGGGIPHNRYGNLVENLCQKYEPSQIGFDVVFARAKDIADDLAFTQTIKNAGNVYFGIPLTARNEPIVGFTYPIKGGNENIPEIEGLGTNLLPQVLENAAGVGHIGKSKSPAYLPLIARYKGKLYPHLTLQIACDYFARTTHIPREKLAIEITPGKYLVLKQKETEEEISPRISIDSAYRMLINLAQCPIKTFGEIMDSSSEVLPDEKGKIVLIGGIKETSGDFLSTPAGRYSGAEIIANAIENIIKRKFLVKPIDEIDMLIFILLICLMAGWILPRLKLRDQIFWPGIILIGYGVLTWYLFKQGIWLEIFRPMLTIGTCSLAIIVIERIGIEKGKKALEEKLKETSDKLKELSEEKGVLLEEKKALVKKKIELLKINETSRKERDRLIEEIEGLKNQLAEKEQQIKETDTQIKEIEEQVKIVIDFKKRQIYSSLRNKKFTIKKTQPFYLLEHIIREGKIHWSEGYIIFSEWRKAKIGQPRSKNSAFIQVVNELNNLLIKNGILENGIVENVRGGQYQLALKEDEYKSNIKEAIRLIEEAGYALLDDEFENARESLLKAITLDENNLAGYRLLKKAIDKLPSPQNKEIRGLMERYEEMLSREINRCKRAVELAHKDPAAVKEENYVESRLEGLEKAGKEKAPTKDQLLAEALDLIKKLQAEQLEETKVYEDAEFEQLLKIDFIRVMVKQLPAIVAKRIFTYWKLSVSENEIIPQIPLCFFNTIKQFNIEDVENRDAFTSRLQKTLVYRLLDEIISDRYGIDIRYLPKIRRLKRVESEIAQELFNKGQSRVPTDEEIRNKMGCREEEYKKIKGEYSKIETVYGDILG